MNPPVPHFRILRPEPRSDRIHLGLRVLDWRAVLQTAGCKNQVIETQFLRWIDNKRRVEFAAGKEVKR